MTFSQREQPAMNVRRNYTAQGRRRYLFAVFRRQEEGRSLKLKAGNDIREIYQRDTME